MFMIGFLVSAFPVNPAKVSAAACAAPTTDYGSVTSPITVTTPGNYRVWSRIQQPNSTSNSYSLEIDGSTCYSAVGGNASLAINTWNWVDYKAGNSATKVDVSLSAGNHTIKMIGDSDGLLLDRIILLESSNTCVPDNITPVLNGPQPGDKCTNSATLKLGDVDNNGSVSQSDLNLVLFNWGKTSRTRATGDLSGDGNVTQTDLNEVLFNWGK